ncbi:serine hydrolase [Winogradskyella thalassocola]|uniref:beta-lactamase n=1 Tax=Winogradskyella thalassocola TaxID=262004 RepID=A0A1G8IZX0_9FLAO|nr:serine hydrolase [Winogradskyella thalassocola]SDI24451.1 beta-lactamase class A [Winogradskyella thalassocola]
MKNIVVLISLVLAYSCESQTTTERIYSNTTQVTQQNTNIQLPIEVKDSITKIDDLRNIQLQSILEKEINKNKTWKHLVANKSMAIGIVDLTDLNSIKYAGINDENMMYAASLPKIAVLLAAMDAIENGELEDSQEIQDDMKLMISKSNNQATTRMIDRVGYAKIEEVLRSPENQLYDEETGGGLWVGKRYGGGGDTNREPLKQLSHAATTKQVCNFYYQMITGNLVTDARSREMLEIMKNPALHHKFVNTLDKIAPKADVYRKSGSWKSYHSDSALVWGPQRRYIIVALIDDNSGETIIRNLVQPLEKAMKRARSLTKPQKI